MKCQFLMPYITELSFYLTILKKTSGLFYKIALECPVKSQNLKTCLKLQTKLHNKRDV